MGDRGAVSLNRGWETSCLPESWVRDDLSPRAEGERGAVSQRRGRETSSLPESWVRVERSPRAVSERRAVRVQDLCSNAAWLAPLNYYYTTRQSPLGCQIKGTSRCTLPSLPFVKWNNQEKLITNAPKIDPTPREMIKYYKVDTEKQ